MKNQTQCNKNCENLHCLNSGENLFVESSQKTKKEVKRLFRKCKKSNRK